MSVKLWVPKVQITLARPFEADFYSYSLVTMGPNVEEQALSKLSEEYQVNSNHPLEYVSLFHSFDSDMSAGDKGDLSDDQLDVSPPSQSPEGQKGEVGDRKGKQTVLPGFMLLKVDSSIDSPNELPESREGRTPLRGPDSIKRNSVTSLTQTTTGGPSNLESHHHEEHLTIRSGPPCPPPHSLQLEEEELNFDRDLVWERPDDEPHVQFTRSVGDLEKVMLVFKLWERVHDSTTLNEVGSCQFAVLPLLRDSSKGWHLEGKRFKEISVSSEDELCFKLKHRGAVEACCTLKVSQSPNLGFSRLPAVLQAKQVHSQD